MTDKAIEAAAKILCSWLNKSWDGLSDEDISNRFPDWSYPIYGPRLQGGKPALIKIMRAAIAAYEQAMWRPIEEAKKDGTPILARIKDCLGREDLERWQGLYVVIRHPGLADDGFDIGWNVAAPVGHGGFPDEWFDGFRPLPPPPGKEGGDDNQPSNNRR